MKDAGFFLACLAILAFPSCTETVGEAVSEDMGEVFITLSAGSGPLPAGKASPEEVQPGSFNIEIFKTDGQSEVRLYKDTYANTEGKAIGLNAGDYRLYAWYGDRNSPGFDAPYYAADVPFTVEGQTETTVEATARLANVMVTVEFGETLANDYDDFYAIVRSGEEAQLKFTRDETREGYVPAGQISLELYADVDGTWMYYPSEPVEYEPGDYVAFSVDTEPAFSSVSLSIKVDDSVELVEKNVSVPSSMLPQDPPSVAEGGFSGRSEIGIVEAQETVDPLKLDFVAGAGIAHCYLEVESSCLGSVPVSPERIDLAAAGDGAAALEEYGIRWMKSMSGQRLAYVDFTGLAERLAAEAFDPENPFSATFTVTLEDMAGKEISAGPFTISAEAPEFSFAAGPEAAWARSIRGLEIGYTRGNPDAIKLQYRAASEDEWKDAELSSDNGSLLRYGNVTGLLPDTEYQLRALYNGNEKTAVTVSLTTEAAAQVANSGFDDWQSPEFEFTYKVLWTNEQHNITWYLPWQPEETDVWWAVNSRVAMPSTTAIVSANWNWVRFPTVAYSSASTEDGRSAVIYTVAVGDWSTSSVPKTSHAGELFIGTADDRGNHSSEGHSFASRPDRLEFMYKYEPCENETFSVYAELKAKDGSTVAVASTDAGSAESSWKKFSLRFQYADVTEKAASIYISFKSSSASSPSVTKQKEITIADGAVYTGHFGSMLYVDDLQLIYE